MTLNVLSKTFPLGAGNKAYVGQARPSSGGGGAWSQPANSIVDFSLNTVVDVQSPDSYAYWWKAFSGVSNFSRDLGTRGGYAISGGGHSDGVTNGSLKLDIATRMFVRTKDSATAFTGPSNLIADSTTGWMFGDTGGTTLQVGEPFACHQYAQNLLIPASAIPGGPAQGHTVTMGRSTMPLTANAGTSRAHRFPHGGPTSTKWVFHGTTNLATDPGYGTAFYDSIRNMTISIKDTGRIINRVKCDTDAVSSVTMSADSEAYYAIGAHFAAKDLYTYIRMNAGNGTFIFKLIDPVTGVVTVPTTTGPGPDPAASGECPFAWVEAWGAWVMYLGMGNTLNILKAPANPLTQPWVWSTATFTGTAQSMYGIGGGPAFNRFAWSELDNVFDWMPRVDAPTQRISVTAP